MKIVLSFLALVASFSVFAQAEYKRKISMLGSPFEITVVAKESFEAKK